MNKFPLILGIAVLLIAAYLSGCTDQQQSVEAQNKTHKIVGEWITQYSSPPQSKWIFYENGVLDLIHEGRRNQYNWYIKEEIYLYVYDENSTAKYLFEMTGNDLLYLHALDQYGYSVPLKRIL